MTAVPADGLPPLVEHGSVPRSTLTRLKDVWEYRELLGNLVRRELKARYKDSVLGFLWTLLNPLLYLVVFSFVFGVIFKDGPPRFGLLFLSGLLVWTLFNTGLGAATASIVGNGPLVQKVWFPREILPLAAVGASIISFFFQLIVLLLGLAVFQQWPKWSQMWMLLPALVAVVLLATGLGLMLGALNVYYRDTGHFLELGLLALFWFTPIVYQYDFLARALREWGGTRAEWIIALNPLVAPIGVFHRVLYNPDNLTPVETDQYFALMVGDDGLLGPLMWVSLVSGIIVFFAGLRVFGRMEANFGEAI